MTEAGLIPIQDQIGFPEEAFEVPDWIIQQLKEAKLWERFEAFPHMYKRLKIGWILEASKYRPEEAQRRLNYLIKMTGKEKMYGTIPEIPGYY